MAVAVLPAAERAGGSRRRSPRPSAATSSTRPAAVTPIVRATSTRHSSRHRAGGGAVVPPVGRGAIEKVGEMVDVVMLLTVLGVDHAGDVEDPRREDDAGGRLRRTERTGDRRSETVLHRAPQQRVVVAGDEVEHVSITDDVGQRRDRPRMSGHDRIELADRGIARTGRGGRRHEVHEVAQQHDLRSHAAGLGEARHHVREGLVLDEGVGIRTGPGRHVEIRPTG